MFKWFFKNDKKAPSRSSAERAPRATTSYNEEIGISQSSVIHDGLKHHQSGRLAEADAAYREVLAGDPENFDALHLSGVIAFQVGQHDAAAELITRALSHNPSSAAACNNLGIVFRA
jgi:Tfp pilus assembly protein PilF